MTHFCIHGPSSLIGKNFCRYLLVNNCTFTVFSRKTSDLDFLKDQPGVTIYRYDQSLSELIPTIDATKIPIGSVFVDLAWAGVFGTEKNDPIQFTINIPQTIAAIELSKKIGVKHWIGIGSQAEYGNIKSDVAVGENFPCQPMTLYGKSKLVCQSISETLCEAYGIERTWLRLFSAYGPYGNHAWFVDHLIEEMQHGRTINATKCEQYLDYLYVDDISDLFIRLAESGGMGIANLGSGKATQLKELIETIRVLTKSKSVINYGVIPYKADQGMFNEADISKLSSTTGWNPPTTIKEGLSKTIEANAKQRTARSEHANK